MFPQIAVGSKEKAEPGVQTSAAAQLRAKDEGASTQALLTSSYHTVFGLQARRSGGSSQ